MPEEGCVLSTRKLLDVCKKGGAGVATRPTTSHIFVPKLGRGCNSAINEVKVTFIVLLNPAHK